MLYRIVIHMYHFYNKFTRKILMLVTAFERLLSKLLLRCEFLSLQSKILKMRPLQMVDTKTQYQKIKQEVDEAVLAVLESSSSSEGR